MADYTLYNNDVPVASFSYEKGTIQEYNPSAINLLPMQIRTASADGFSYWLSNRSIDLNTLQHRRLMYELIGSRDIISIALATHMFSLSDTFTCFCDHEFIPRKSICTPSEQSAISSFILLSSDTSLRNARIATPNASTDGSYVKTWQYENGDWWLYKLQSIDASKTQHNISRVLSAIGWDTAIYEYQKNYRKRIKTLCFVNDGEFFEPYDSFRFQFTDRSDDEEVINANIASLGPAFELAWQRILLADAVFMNTDRHIRNFGVIRSSKTGQILRLAPNFDNNQAYKANPVHYSSTMFKQYANTTQYEYSQDLKTLITECKKYPYLTDVVTAISPFIS